MKKIFLLSLSLCVFLISNAQIDTLALKKQELEDAKTKLATAKANVDQLKKEVASLTPPIIWKKGGFSAITFNSLGLTNWAAGGVSSNSVSALGNIFANYKKDNIEWVNNLDLAYGLIQNEGETFRKNEDKIDFLTKAGIAASPKLNYAALFNFKSQFAPGFDFNDPTIEDSERPVISKFLSPAFVLASLGFDYKFTDYFSVYLSPATGKFTIVNDDSIASQNIYIPSKTDADGIQYYNDNFRAEFGALMTAILKKNLTKKISLNSTLNLFNNYTDKNVSNRENIDVNWELLMNMKLTQFISASLFTHLVHDNDIAVPIYENDVLIGEGPRTQFKRLIGIGFRYEFE